MSIHSWSSAGPALAYMYGTRQNRAPAIESVKTANQTFGREIFRRTQRMDRGLIQPTGGILDLDVVRHVLSPLGLQVGGARRGYPFFEPIAELGIPRQAQRR